VAKGEHRVVADLFFFLVSRASNTFQTMEQKFGSSLRRLPPFLPTRRERLELRVPLVELAVASGIPLATLSRTERGIGRLSPAQEERRRAALEELSARKEAG
jgi:hypothetical protein